MTDQTETATMLRLPRATLSAIHRALGEVNGPADAARLARQIGYEASEGLLEQFRTEVGGEEKLLPADAFWDRMTGFLEILGWGELQFEALHPAVGSLSAPRLLESEGRRTEHPGCHVTTGLLAGIVSGVAGTDLAVLEVECRSSGADRCRFLFGGGDALQRVYSDLRDGSHYTEALARLG